MIHDNPYSGQIRFQRLQTKQVENLKSPFRVIKKKKKSYN